MKILIDEEKCCGAGQCVIQCPEVFDQREDDGIVVLLDANPPAEIHPKLRMAARLCPAAVIELVE
ncbi:ferredoxin [Bordetella sp. 2513F-2]